ncbi:RDD family protein [Caldalkalibacillus salinus]|uniref:RDD family protein n=1 Tax=Caldalkalibacillus salinus TaxID=2803787 RepID=UPI0019231380|nr:RDD family protein [Caldalkalibacillus salinus]
MDDQKWIDKMLAPQLRAGWQSRAVCFFYDGVYLLLLMLGMTFLTTIWMLIIVEPPYTMDPLEIRRYLVDHHPHLLMVDHALKVSAFVLYFFMFPLIGHDYRTLGMVTFGLSFMNEKGQRITRRQYLVRETCKWLMFPGCYQVLKKDKRALHDKWAGTYMVLN